LLCSVGRWNDHFGEGTANLIRTLVVVDLRHSEVRVSAAVAGSRACFFWRATVSLRRVAPRAIIVASINASVTLVRQTCLVHIKVSVMLVLMKQLKVKKLRCVSVGNNEAFRLASCYIGDVVHWNETKGFVLGLVVANYVANK